MSSWPLNHLTVGVNSVTLQLLISTQISQSECQNWGNQVLKDATIATALTPLMSKWMADTANTGLIAFLNGRILSISSALVSLTSSIEYYFKGIIIESSRKNVGLRKKGYFEKTEDGGPLDLFSAKNLEDYALIEHAIIHVIRLLGSRHSKGEDFTSKAKKASSFLDVDANIFERNLPDSLDGLFRLRNNIAHTDMHRIEKRSILTLSGANLLYDKYKPESYLSFVMAIIEIIDATQQAFEIYDKAVLAKWVVEKPISHSYL